MEKKVCFVIGLFVIVSLLSIGVFAGFDYVENNIVQNYSAGESIEGTFNMSFDSQNANSPLTCNFDGEISLIDFLNANGLSDGSGYQCSPQGCLEDYSSVSQINNIEIGSADSVVGFKVQGNSVWPVEHAKLTITTAISASCSPQLWIDVLNKGEAVLTNNQPTESTCSATYGNCFDSEASASEATITDSASYCEKMTLPAGPSYYLISHIKNETQNTGAELTMTLYDFETNNNYGSCTLPKNSEDGVYEELGCVVDYSSAVQGEYFVCLKADSESGYTIRTETSSPTCGTSSFGELNRDFEIFAKQMEFAEIQTIEIENQMFEDAFGQSLGTYISNYISEKYGGFCMPECIIPIEFHGQDATFFFSDVEIKYSDGGAVLFGDKIYSLETSSATLTSDLLSLDLSHANFEIPIGSEDEDKFELYIGGELIFEESLNIAESFAFDVSPKFVSFGQSTNFVVETSENITKSTWDFGDGSSSETVDGKTLQHTYLEQGILKLEIVIERNDGVTAKKSFSIVVGDAKEVANLTIQKYNRRIGSLGPAIESYPDWINLEIKKNFDVDSLASSLETIEKNYEESFSDEDYQTVMRSLIGLDIPKNITTTKRSENVFPLAIGYENMNPNYIEDLSDKTAENSAELREAIGGWMNTFYDSTISFEQISAVYDDDSDVLMSKFEINTAPVLEPKDSSGKDYNPFLILGYGIEDNGKFKKDYNQKSLGSGTYIALKNEKVNEVFEFVVFTEYDVENFGAYISPNINRLGVIEFVEGCDYDGICEKDEGENKKSCPDDCKTRWSWFTIWITIVLFSGLIIYIVLQEWYKKHYEKTLFKDKNDLYNIITFVYNSRKSGLSNSEIRSKLRGSGWTGEKINYIMKKIDGRKTGLYEIPLFKFFETKKVKKEIQKRAGAPVDARFIKQPGL